MSVVVSSTDSSCRAALAAVSGASYSRVTVGMKRPHFAWVGDYSPVPKQRQGDFVKNFTSALVHGYNVPNSDCRPPVKAAGWAEPHRLMCDSLEMRPHSKLLKCTVVLLLATAIIRGGSPAAEQTSLPAAPGDLVLDAARAMPDKAKAALSDELREFREATGCSLYVVSTTFLSGKSVRDYADDLSEAWIPSGQGMVLAYDRASDAHAVSPTQRMWETYPTPTLVEAFREAGILLQEKGAPLEKRLVAGSSLLMKRVNEAERQRRLHNQLLPGHELWAALVFLALLVAGALGCVLIIAQLRKRDAANGIRYFFRRPRSQCGSVRRTAEA